MTKLSRNQTLSNTKGKMANECSGCLSLWLEVQQFLGGDNLPGNQNYERQGHALLIDRISNQEVIT